MNNNKKKATIYKYIHFIFLLFCFVTIPAIIISFSVYRYYQIDEEHLIYDLKTFMQKVTSEQRRIISPENYFCRFFHEYNIFELNNEDSNLEDNISFCKKLKKYFGNDIDFVVLTNEAEIKYNSNPKVYNFHKKNWLESLNYIRHQDSMFHILKNYKNKGDFNSVKYIFGPNVINDYLYSLYRSNNYSLIWGDSSEKHRPGGVYFFKWGGFFVFISKNLLNDYKHFKYDISDKYSENIFITGLYQINNTDYIWTNKPLKQIDEVKEILFKDEFKDKKFIETYNYYICNQFLNDKINIFTLVSKKNTILKRILKSLLVFVFYFILSSPFIKYLWNIIVLNISGEVSIRLKIAFLFIFATGIPLMLFAVMSREYKLYKRITLIKEAKSWSIEKLLGVEERYLSFLKDLSIKIDTKVNKWAEGLKKNKLTNEYFLDLSNAFKDYGNLDYFIVGSDTKIVATRDGFFKYNGQLDAIKFDLNNSIIYNKKDLKSKNSKEFNNYLKKRIKDFEIINIICKKLCNDLNRTEIPQVIMSKLEIIAESIMQKSFPEMIYSMIENIGSIKKWGIGNRTTMAFFKLLSIFDNKKTDYVFIASWHLYEIEQIFIDNNINKINRNNKNFKFAAFYRAEKKLYSTLKNINTELIRFAKSAEPKPTEELEIININGENYIAVSILGNNLTRFNLIGLYPIKNVDNEINNQTSLFLTMGLFCSVLSLGLAQLLLKCFINPLNKLQNGAIAIEKRNFEHRITELDRDEFGKVGSIFNNVMNGLEELKLAKVVQESMFPEPDFKQGKFSIYGKSVTMIDVGGDYLDFFKIDDNSFSLLIGDVAGHGVGAAVIMAMAKAVILGCSNELSSPETILNSIHKVILAAKNSKQRKIMTFQYMYVNTKTGDNLFANAGGCSPWLIRHSENTIEEIKKPGPTLGAFKKAIYHHSALDFRPGDAIVFYTDGIVECKDKNGEMLGYDRLKELLLNSWDKNPKNYYTNIYKAYLEYIGVGAKPEDDLTIIILMYNE